MSVKIEGAQAISNRFKELAREVATKKEKQQILAAGAAPIVTKSRTLIPKSKETHYYQRGGKKIEIVPGNLRKSMRAYRQLDGNVSIGPRRLKKAPAVFGADPKTASGFYAAARFKKAVNFRQQVTEKAAQEKTADSLKRMDKQIARILKKYQ